MLRTLLDHIEINIKIGMPHPYWNSLGRHRYEIKLTNFIEEKPTSVVNFPRYILNNQPHLAELYINGIANHFKNGKLNLSELLFLTQEYNGTEYLGLSLIRTEEEAAIKLAQKAMGKKEEKILKIKDIISETCQKIETGSRYDCDQSDHHHRVTTYYYETIKKMKVDIKTIISFERERDSLGLLAKKQVYSFPKWHQEQSSLFEKMLQALPSDKEVETLEDQIRTYTEHSSEQEEWEN